MYTQLHITQLCASSAPNMINFACHNPLIQIRTGIRWFVFVGETGGQSQKLTKDQSQSSASLIPAMDGLNGIVKMLILTQ